MKTIFAVLQGMEKLRSNSIARREEHLRTFALVIILSFSQITIGFSDHLEVFGSTEEKKSQKTLDFADWDRLNLLIIEELGRAFERQNQIMNDEFGTTIYRSTNDDKIAGSATLSSGNCRSLDWNDPTNKSLIAVSATASTSGSISVLIDGSLSNNNFFYPDVSIAGLEVVRVTFPNPEILTGLEYAIGNSYMFNTNATVKVQGSNDGMTWTDMTPTATGTSPSLVISGNEYTKDRSLGNNHPGVLSSSNYSEMLFWTNASSYIHYRILGVSGNTNQNPWINELFFQTADGFDVSNLGCNDNGTATTFSDDLLTFDFTPIRGNGTYSLAVDGGYTISPSTGIFGQTTSFTISTGSAGAGDLNLTLTDSNVPCTTNIVVPNTTNGCLPGSCGEPDWNEVSLKSTISGDFHIPGTGSTDGPLAVLVDGDNTTGVGSKNNSFTNTAVFTINFPQATVLHGIEVEINSSSTEPVTGGQWRVEASNDGVTYTPISIDFTYGGNLLAGAGQYSSATRAYTFPFSSNTNAYTHYRVFAMSMSTRFGRSFNELHFGYTFFDAQLTNQGCNDNSTFTDYTDDLVTFDLDPTPGTAGNSYNVEILGNHSISPTTGTYGQVTSFTVSSGSSGSGDLNLVLYDATENCAQEIVVENEENACIPGPCGGPDWNVVAQKTTLTGDFHIPGTGATDGPLAVLVDGNSGSTVGTKNNNFSNTAVFTINFPEATVLHGIEVEANSSSTEPITGGQWRVEASNDGITYTPISVDFTYGSNLTASAGQYSSAARAYTFPFAANTEAYTYYRIFAMSMSTRFGRSFNELYFDYDVFDPGIANLTVDDNGTGGVFNDDFLAFELNPGPGVGNYSLQAVGTFTISPSTGTYGQATSFQTSAGTAGTGDLTLRLIDEAVPCVQDFTLPNPDLTADVVANQAACTSPTDEPLGTVIFTATDDVFVKAEYNTGTVYAGTGFASAIDMTNTSAGFELVNNLPNPEYTTYYTVRAYVSETLHRDFVVSLDPKSCSVADLSLSVSPSTDTANEGEQMTYMVTLTNAGPNPAVNVEVKVDVPAGLDLLSTTPTIGEYSAGTQLWKADLVPVGDHQLSITYRMK